MAVSYEDWGQVPWSMASKSQLLAADLPREPVGGMSGHVLTYHRGRRGAVGLYRVEATQPTASSARQLEAAARRRTRQTHVCEGCGACCDRPLVAREEDRLCPMCWRLRDVAALQVSLRERRGVLAEWARGLLEDSRLAVVWVQMAEGERTVSQRARPAVAAHVTAVDSQGAKLADVVVRLAGVRSRQLPQGACSPGTAVGVLEEALGGRRVLAWTQAQVSALTRRLEALGCPLRLAVVSGLPGADWDGWQTSVRDRVSQWRGQIDPGTGTLLPAWEPGRADRLRLLLTRIAASAEPTREEAGSEAD